MMAAQQAASAPCRRCNGAQEFKSYRHIMAGVCFRCEGTGREPRAEDRVAAATRSAAASAKEVVVLEERLAVSLAKLAAPAVKRELNDVDRRILAAFIAQHGEAEANRRDEAADTWERTRKLAVVERAQSALAAARQRLVAAEAELARVSAQRGAK